MTPPGPPLAARFQRHLRAAARVEEGDGVVVALSGGADSVALLHLLRFTAGLPALRLVAVHVDHGMRPSSAGDAAWVKGLCHAWSVPLLLRRLDPAPAGEAEARRRRYDELEAVRREEGARWVVTAHHADDQAETVLFRAARGAGPAGLRGIRETRAPGVWRPLLPFTRDELRAYATAVGLGWRDDPTNRDPMARNVLRHQILPRLEAVVPGAGRALARLAGRARDEEAAWRGAEAALLERVGLREEADGLSLDRDALVGFPTPLRARLLRAVARRAGGQVGGAGTHRAVEFTSSGSSGSSVPLGGGLVLRRELDRLHVAWEGERVPDQEAVVEGPGDGEATARLGAVAFRVRWSRHGLPEEGGGGGFPVAALDFPLTVRGWRPGDRIRRSYGTKKLKKVLLEARVPGDLRRRMPVLVDAGGAVLWVPGVVRAHGTEATEGEDVLYIGITHAESH